MKAMALCRSGWLRLPGDSHFESEPSGEQKQTRRVTVHEQGTDLS